MNKPVRVILDGEEWSDALCQYIARKYNLPAGQWKSLIHIDNHTRMAEITLTKKT